MGNKKIITYMCTTMIFLSSFNQIYADTAPYVLLGNSAAEKEETNEEINRNKKVLDLSVESAVSYGLEHNKDIEMLENKIQLSIITSQNANVNSNDLKDAEELLEDASNEISHKKKELRTGQEQIDKAKILLEQGIAPTSIPLVDSSGNLILDGDGNQVVLSAGTNILNALISMGIPTDTAKTMESIIKSSVEDKLSSNQDTIDESGIALNEAETTLKLKQDEFKEILKDTSEKLGMKINYNSVVKLDADDAAELMIDMAGVNLNITRYAKNIYRNQIAMLIQKNYYDALYAQKVLELKKVAKERGELQYNIIKLSYENGMKAKDDLLLSKMYYDSTIISVHLAEANYKNAISELKMNMNLDMDTEITLQDSMLKEITAENLDEGLKSGLKNRIEIQQNLGQLTIYQLNENILNSRAEYRSNNRAIKEAKLLKERAEIQLDKTKTLVKTQINQSYEMMVAAGEMLKSSEELVKNAEEVVGISKLKYEQGFGAENALLKEMNLQESSGTIIELIAAQEKLSEVEAQVAQIRYSYTMAKIKYFNDAGILIY